MRTLAHRRNQPRPRSPDTASNLPPLDIEERSRDFVTATVVEHLTQDVVSLVEHLNDGHRWSRERIADFLEHHAAEVEVPVIDVLREATLVADQALVEEAVPA